MIVSSYDTIMATGQEKSCRSLRELEIAANLEHEQLVRVYHVGEHASQHFFTMQLAEKCSLDKPVVAYRLQTAPATTAAAQEAVEEQKKEIAGLMPGRSTTSTRGKPLQPLSTGVQSPVRNRY